MHQLVSVVERPQSGLTIEQVVKLRCQDGYVVDCQRMMAVGLAITARQC